MSRIEDSGAEERLRERAISNGKYLGELLAVIHRDGGHYQALHGDAKAVTDAIQAVFSLHTTGADARDQLAAKAAEITRLRAEVERLQRIARNRDMWRGQCKGQAEQLRMMRAALSNSSQAEGQNG